MLVASGGCAIARALSFGGDVTMERSSIFAIEENGIFSASLKKVRLLQLLSQSTRIKSPPQTCSVAIRFDSGCTSRPLDGALQVARAVLHVGAFAASR